MANAAFVFFVPLCGLLLSDVVAVDPSILLEAILGFEEDVFIVFARDYSDAWRYFLCRGSGFL